MLQRSAENRHLRPIAGLFNDNPRSSGILANRRTARTSTLSLHSSTSNLTCLISAPTIPAERQSFRIDSAAPSITEALFALGLGKHVVGVWQRKPLEEA